MTYKIVGYLVCEGKTTLEPAVIKYAWNNPCYIAIYGELECHTSDFANAIFTAIDDDTVGEILPDSGGATALQERGWASYWAYGHPMLAFVAPQPSAKQLALQSLSHGVAREHVWLAGNPQLPIYQQLRGGGAL